MTKSGVFDRFHRTRTESESLSLRLRTLHERFENVLDSELFVFTIGNRYLWTGPNSKPKGNFSDRFSWDFNFGHGSLKG